jgi:hypothetical protein
VIEANGAEKLKCSYKKCNNQLATKEQLICAVTLCKKNAACFQHYLSQANSNFELRTDVFCFATKACCTKFHIGNQSLTTYWYLDGPIGPNTVPNSETEFYLIVGLWEITGPHTTEERVIMENGNNQKGTDNGFDKLPKNVPLNDHGYNQIHKKIQKTSTDARTSACVRLSYRRHMQFIFF